MFKLKTILFCLFLTSVLAAGQADVIIAGGQDSSPGSSAPDVLSTVNGTPISRNDVMYQFKTTGGRNRPALTQDYLKTLLEGIVRDELIYQRAMVLGLDGDPGYQKALALAMVQINAYKREKLAEIFFQREVTEKAIVSDPEAQAYFDKNAGRIRTELHVHQILKRNEAQIEPILKELQQGASFDSVARKQFPEFPATLRNPWDLGYLRWKQVPESWRNVVYDLKPGQHSNIIPGPNRRFWIVKLVDRRENQALAFTDVRQEIKDILKDEKVRQLREKTLQDLRNQARIEYYKLSVDDFKEKETE